MAAVPDILLWVQEVGFSERRGVHVIYGHDFRTDFGWSGGDFPSELFAFRAAERIPLRGIDIANVHRFSKGWAWETNAPERLPEPPFLLTDDSLCRLAFAGRVRFEPTGWATDEVAAEFEEFGTAPVPLFGCGWFGVLAVERAASEFGHLSAFTREAVRVAGAFEMGWAGEDRLFGRVLVPKAGSADAAPGTSSGE